MNVIWIVADTFRQDHIGAYGNKIIHTPSLDSLASRSIRFDRHYVNAFPTVPARADHHTGRYTMSFMGWEPLPESEVTLAQILAQNGFTTAAAVDTPFYLRGGMNLDRGFQAFFTNPSQLSAMRMDGKSKHESWDVRAAWRYESDRSAPQTFTLAMQWLERHYKEDFFLYVDTWDPHEPWDAPDYYTELYWPGYDGEVIEPIYGSWRDVPGFTEEKVKKAHATYCGEVTMVDTWVGHILRCVENMGLTGKTAIVFTTDHGFYFGEHGGLFGKMAPEMGADGILPDMQSEDVTWGRDPLYEETILIPLLVHLPGIQPGGYGQLTSAVDVMPTVLDILGQEIPQSIEGSSLLPKMRDTSLAGRDFVVSSEPFTNPGDPVRYVDNISRMRGVLSTTTVTTEEWSLLYSVDPGISELYNLKSDPRQQQNVISSRPEVAKELHQHLVKFMRDTNLSPHLLEARSKLQL